MKLSHYETIIILRPELQKAEVTQSVERYKQLLQEQGAEISFYEPWGVRQLAYPIRKLSSGDYHILEFTAGPHVVAILEREYGRDEQVLRYFTCALDKHALAYKSKKREAKQQASSTPSDQAAISAA